MHYTAPAESVQPKENLIMKHTITLSKVSGKWMATFSNPHKIAAATGANTFPTTYTTRTCAEVVQKAIQRLNPDCIVIVSNQIDKAAFL